MTHQLRRPRPSTSKYIDSPRPSTPRPNTLLNGAVCDGCRWPARCALDALCWALEKSDIAAERLLIPGWGA